MPKLVTVREMASAYGVSDVWMLTRLREMGFDVTSPNELVHELDLYELEGDLFDDTLEDLYSGFYEREPDAPPSRLPTDILKRSATRLISLANVTQAELRRIAPRKDGSDSEYKSRLLEARQAFRRVRSAQHSSDLDPLVEAVGDLLHLAAALGVQVNDVFADYNETTQITASTPVETIYEPQDLSASAPLLIQTVSDSLLALLAREPRLLFDVSPRKFEEIIAELFHRAGYEVHLTKATRDGGKDIIAVSRHMDVVTKLIVECKRYQETRKVDLSIVQRLLGVKIATAANKALLATTSSFTRDARKFAKDHFWDLELKDLGDIRRWLQPYALGASPP